MSKKICIKIYILKIKKFNKNNTINNYREMHSIILIQNIS